MLLLALPLLLQQMLMLALSQLLVLVASARTAAYDQKEVAACDQGLVLPNPDFLKHTDVARSGKRIHAD